MTFNIKQQPKKAAIESEDIQDQGLFYADRIGCYVGPGLYFKAKDGIYALDPAKIGGGHANFNRWDSPKVTVYGYKKIRIDHIDATEIND